MYPGARALPRRPLAGRAGGAAARVRGRARARPPRAAARRDVPRPRAHAQGQRPRDGAVRRVLRVRCLVALFLPERCFRFLSPAAGSSQCRPGPDSASREGTARLIHRRRGGGARAAAARGVASSRGIVEGCVRKVHARSPLPPSLCVSSQVLGRRPRARHPGARGRRADARLPRLARRRARRARRAAGRRGGAARLGERSSPPRRGRRTCDHGYYSPSVRTRSRL